MSRQPQRTLRALSASVYLALSFSMMSSARGQQIEPLDRELVRGDRPAEMIVERLAVLHPAAAIEVIGKHREVNPVTGHAYTILKTRVGDQDVTATINETTGDFAPDSGLAEREAQQLLNLLSPVYLKMDRALLGHVRDLQGGTLEAAVGGDQTVSVLFYTQTREGLDAIQRELGNVPIERFDLPDLWAKNPPIIHPDENGLVAAVPVPENIRTIETTLPLSKVLEVGGKDFVSRVGSGGKATTRLDISMPHVRMNVVRGFGYRGSSADCAIIDSGIDDTHPNLPYVIAEMDFTGASRFCVGGADDRKVCVCAGGACVAGTCNAGATVGKACVAACAAPGVCEGPEDDTNGHGTHVAGIVGSTHATFRGMADLVDEINAKAIPGSNAVVTAAIAFALNPIPATPSQGADVINGSYGRSSMCTAPAAMVNAVTGDGVPCVSNASCDTAPGNGVCSHTSNGQNTDAKLVDNVVFANNVTVVIAAEELPFLGACSNNVNRPCNACTAPAASIGSSCTIDADCFRCTAPPASVGNTCTVNANCDRCTAPAASVGKVCTVATVIADCNQCTAPLASVGNPCTINAHCDPVPPLPPAPGTGVCGVGVCGGGVCGGVCQNCVAPGVCQAKPSTPNDAFNVITVGSSTVGATAGAAAVWTDFSAVGPTFDGRSKPDVLAPGASSVVRDDIDSCNNNWEGANVCTAPPANVGFGCGVNADCDSAAGGDGVCTYSDQVCVNRNCTAPAANVGNRCSNNASCDPAPPLPPAPGTGACAPGSLAACTAHSDCDTAPAAGNGFCVGADFVDKTGTSMAAPHVSGLASVLWDFGARNDILTDTPYLKAAIINNCNRLPGPPAWTHTPSKPLDVRQGAGEIDALATWKAYVDDLRIWQQRVTGIAPEQSHWYWMDVKGPKDVVVTLVFERHTSVPNTCVGGARNGQGCKDCVNSTDCFGSCTAGLVGNACLQNAHCNTPGVVPPNGVCGPVGTCNCPTLPPLNDLDLRVYDHAGLQPDPSISIVDSVEHIVFNPSTFSGDGRYCVEVDPYNLPTGGSELYAVAANYPLNFTGTTNPCKPDFGDAPDPFTGAAQYPTLLSSNGARHLDWTKEWLGTSRPEIDGELKKGTLAVVSRVDPFPSVSGETDADDPNDQDGVKNLVNADNFDDGVGLPIAFIPNVAQPITITVQTTVDDTGVGPTGRYQDVAAKRLYVNAWCDWNGDGDWVDAGEKIIGVGSPTGQYQINPENFGPNGRYTIGEAFTDSNASGAWEPGETQPEGADTAGKTERTFVEMVTPPAVIAAQYYCRFRLDYGEDVGNSFGPAQFGEVEDYLINQQKEHCGPGPHWIDSCAGGVDRIESSTVLAEIDLDFDPFCAPDATLILDGPVFINRSAALDDSVNFPGEALVDGHRDVIDTEIVSMQLVGGGATLRAGAGQGVGPFGGLLAASKGAIVEQATNNALGDSFFEVFFEIDLGGGTFVYNQQPALVEAVLEKVPPKDKEYLHLRDCVGLFTSPVPGRGIHVANLAHGQHCIGGPCPQKKHCGPGPHWVDSCPTGLDVLDPTQVLAAIDLDFDPFCAPDATLILDGPVLIDRSEPQDDSGIFFGTRPVDGHLDVIDTEILSMVLSGGGATLRAGAGQGVGPSGGLLAPTYGTIAEQAGDNTMADSFFDVFFEIDMGGGLFVYNQAPVRVTAELDKAPPKDKRYLHILGCVPLFTSPRPGTGIHVANLAQAQHCIGSPCPTTVACCLVDCSCTNLAPGICSDADHRGVVAPGACQGDGGNDGVDDACLVACCDHLKGTCDDVPVSECTCEQCTFTCGTTCAALEASGGCRVEIAACCDHDTFGSCTNTSHNACNCQKCEWIKGKLCEEVECTHLSIPTVSEWGLVVMTLLLLTGAKIYFGRRRLETRNWRLETRD